MTKDNWPPEETRYFFQLYAEERRKGNRTSTSMNKVGKENIMVAFEDRFKKGYDSWQTFKNKYDTSRLIPEVQEEKEIVKRRIWL
ncbi:unnamed protein product [Brassica oleracea var. botrytis]